jgi:hypothetical protein
MFPENNKKVKDKRRKLLQAKRIIKGRQFPVQ